MFHLHIKLDNAAFGDEPEYEVARILKALADDVLLSATGSTHSGKARDANGNVVGSWSIEPTAQ